MEYIVMLFLYISFIVNLVFLIELSIGMIKLSVFNPVRNYREWKQFNVFGVCVLTLLLYIIFPVFGFVYLVYLLFTFGRHG